MRVGVEDGVVGAFAASKAAAAVITVMKVSAAEGFWKGG